MKAEQAATAAQTKSQIDKDLFEVSVAQLEKYYGSGKYTVTQVVQWHLARVKKYNSIYRAVQTIDVDGALRVAAQEDAMAKQLGTNFKRGPLWGVPIVIKANTNIAGQITTDGWEGYAIPGHEFMARLDAPIVARLKAAGAVIIGHSNMPDFANSDTTRSSVFGRTGNAYDVRFSPGGSSGGTVTAVTAQLAVLGTGTDTGNSIRMPSATSALVGMMPTRGLVSTAGIAPLDWLLDNTGPIARTVNDAAVALSVMAGEDPADPVTLGSHAKAQAAPYTQYLKSDSLKGKRFGVPAFIMRGLGVEFQGIEAAIPDDIASTRALEAQMLLRPETLAAFMKALDGMRAAGAIIVFDENLLAESFTKILNRIATKPYIRHGTEMYLSAYGPDQYRSVADYEKVLGKALPPDIIGGSKPDADPKASPASIQRRLDTDPLAAVNYFGPRSQALEAYHAAFDRFQLDGLVYPAIQMPPPDETMAQDGQLSTGPHSSTLWANMIGVPAIVVPGGFYPSGLPFGLELSAKPWRDGDLLGYAYAYEQATHHRRAPVLVEGGLLPNVH